MMLSVGYLHFNILHLLFFFLGYHFMFFLQYVVFWGFLPNIFTQQCGFTLTFTSQREMIMSLYQGIQKILKNSVEGRVLYVCFQWLLLGHMTQPNALIERIYIYIYIIHTLLQPCPQLQLESSSSPMLCMYKPEINCQGDANSSFGTTSMQRIWELGRRRWRT